LDSPSTHICTVCVHHHKKRLDVFLTQMTPSLTRAHIQRLIRQGNVCHHSDNPSLEGPEGRVIQDPGKLVKEGDTYTLYLEEEHTECHLEPHPMDLSILYEDTDLLVLDKPPGLVVHPGAGEHVLTLVHGLLAHCGSSLSGIGGVKKPGLVHRLDKDTSGVMVVAKNDFSHHHLCQQFSERTLEKIYWAFTLRPPKVAVGRVDTLITRHPQNRLKMSVSTLTGRQATTAYRVLKTSQQATLLECRPLTGRTHQIRVHCAHMGIPILGDTLYGGPPLHPRQALHAKVLTFTHPRTHERISFDCPLPQDLQQWYHTIT